MRCWEALLPHTVRHPAIKVDLLSLLASCQSRYAGAMYSGCGGGYLFVASEDKVPGGIKVKIRRARKDRRITGLWKGDRDPVISAE
jgi:hypothetical protein